MKYALAYDVGTTGVKTCLFEIDENIRLIAGESEGYELYVLPGGGAEQDPEEWWAAMCRTTKAVLEKTGLDPKKIDGISFCSQAQGLVLVDKEGKPVRRAMSYMDQRARKELKEGMANGIQIAGANIFKLIPSLMITGAVSSSVKDPIWKYNWVKNNEPDVFARVYKWFDVKEALICRMTGAFIMTQDSAFGTLLYDIKNKCWSPKMCKMVGVNIDHLPQIIKSTDKAGELLPEAAQELGLAAGIPVFGGGSDASLIGVGAGASSIGKTHVYMGTSGWVSTVVPPKALVDTSAMIAAITGASDRSANYFAELETAGKCVEWVKDHLALDEVGIYMKKHDVTEGEEMETKYTSLYTYLQDVIKTVPAGSNGVVFTPWFHGNRCPFEDPNARAMFFNMNLETGKSDLIRAVVEGVCFHMRWFIEAQERKVPCSDPIRFVGGGALGEATCQILADCLGRRVETVAASQNVGAVGAAAVVAAGLGLVDDVNDTEKFIKVAKTYRPDPGVKAV
ncbi:MAG: FGGY-family carbohydrate kinase, partial [Clostridia bacterium]|nr:FGGY-family carbohydrate kinase [Clostridia bacterium]